MRWRSAAVEVVVGEDVDERCAVGIARYRHALVIVHRKRRCEAGEKLSLQHGTASDGTGGNPFETRLEPAEQFEIARQHEHVAVRK